ncbi:hypothetical protein L1D31_13655 [Vibrio sp. Isolate23]|uniref:hypothetical protein n=1 Tax=Vibrio sp. Isolate23 TaxID=2908533 RepID=UPI001EFDF83E|nr:hypothetical protein [Vibrio sp. Isolate23]MCG9683616.1 hypothetical protein [Vibrio sp. Isolate23]
MGTIIRVGFDLAKNVFNIHAVDENEKKADLAGKKCKKHMVKSDHETSVFYSNHWNGSMWLLLLQGKRTYQRGVYSEACYSSICKALC